MHIFQVLHRVYLHRVLTWHLNRDHKHLKPCTPPETDYQQTINRVDRDEACNYKPGPSKLGGEMLPSRSKISPKHLNTVLYT